MIGVTTPWVEGPAGMRLVAARQWRGTIFQQHKANLQLVLSRHSHVSFQHVTSRLAVSFISRARPFSRAGATPTNTGKRVWLARLKHTHVLTQGALIYSSIDLTINLPSEEPNVPYPVCIL